MNARHLPGNWSSTGNALKGLAFLAKDAMLAIDDFAPAGSANDVQRLHRDADRVFRAQGNNSGRQRMRADATVRSSRPPRGLLVSTGEDIPLGQSLRARLFVVEVGPHDVRWDQITMCQADARAGRYAEALAGFLRWQARRYEELRGELDGQVAALRDNTVQRGVHRRTPANVAQWGVGVRAFIAFAVEEGILNNPGARVLWNRCWTALEQSGGAQTQHQDASDPTHRFRTLLRAALASGEAHVADPDGIAPQTPGAWGWRRATVGTGDYQRDEWRPLGARVGWVNGDDLYLEAEAVFSVLRRVGNASGDGLTVTLATLRKRLHEQGLLASTDTRGGRIRYEVRRTLDGRRLEVLHVTATTFMSEEVSPVSQVSRGPHREPRGGRRRGRCDRS